MYETILVPTDGSPGSELAVERAVDLAGRYGATLHFLSVVDEDVVNHYAGIDAVEDVEGSLEERGLDAAVAAEDRAATADVAAETHLRRGVPHEAIVDAAADLGATLVVMGTERRSGEYRRLLGSVTERVVRLADAAVLVVKADAHTE
jgi:nucleotide-binding universal stress UspA family protein